MSIIKNVGGLYQLKSSVKFSKNYPLKLCLVIDHKIDNRSSWSDRCLVGHDVFLVLVKPNMDLTMETATNVIGPWDVIASTAAGASTAVCSVAAAGGGSEVMSMYWKNNYNLARYQWLENKCIPGSAFMVPDGSLIWISDYDLPYFEEVEL